MKKYFLLMILSAGSLLAKDTVLSKQVLPEKVLKLGEDQQKLITFLRKSKMLKGSKKQKQDMLFLVLSQMKNSNFQQVCGSLGIRLKGKKARITVANRKKFLNFFKKENAADVEKAYSSLAQSYLKASGVSASLSGTLPSEKKVEALLKQGKFEEALTQAKKQGTPHHPGAELPKAPIVWGARETKKPSSEAPIVWGASENQTSSGTSVAYYLPYAPSVKDFQEVYAAAQQADVSLISNVALRSQFEKKLLNPTDKMENESLNQQVEEVFQAKRRVEQIQADLGTRTIDLTERTRERNDARTALGLRITELGTRTTERDAAQASLVTLAGQVYPGSADVTIDAVTNRISYTPAGGASVTVTLADLQAAATVLGKSVADLLTWQRTLREDLLALVQEFKITPRGRVGYVNRANCTQRLQDLEARYR